MDEPFGALDALTRLQVRTDLEALWLRRRPTVLFITHSVEEAVGLSDRILVMSASPGEVVDDIEVDLPRPPDHARRRPGIRRIRRPYPSALRAHGHPPRLHAENRRVTDAASLPGAAAGADAGSASVSLRNAVAEVSLTSGPLNLVTRGLL